MRRCKLLLLICLPILVFNLSSEGSLQVARASNPKIPERIVSLAPSITEILFELGLNKKIVGVTDFCNYPEEAKAKPRIGGFFNPNLEAIVSLEPDLVIGISNLGNKSVIKGLVSLDIQTLMVKSFMIDDILDSVLKIGKATGVMSRADDLVLDLRKRIEKIKDLIRGSKKVKVLFVFSYEPLIVAGKETFADELLSLAGGENIVRDIKGRYSRYSIEEVISKEPEVIIATVHENPSSLLKESKNVRGWEKWKNLLAVKSGRIYVVSEDFYFRPGPRFILGLEKIAEILHPEVF